MTRLPTLGPQGGYQTNIGDTDSPYLYEFDNSTKLMADSIKIGLNWRFGTGP